MELFDYLLAKKHGGSGSSLTISNCNYLFYANARLNQLNDILKICKNITSATSMFSSCTDLTTLDLTIYDLGNISVTSTSGMFQNCSNLTSLNMSNFNASPTDTIQSMFQGCRALTHLDIRNFDFTKAQFNANVFGSNTSNYVPANCEIIVKDETQKNWIASYYSRLTNVKTVDEYENV